MDPLEIRYLCYKDIKRVGRIKIRVATTESQKLTRVTCYHCPSKKGSNTEITKEELLNNPKQFFLPSNDASFIDYNERIGNGKLYWFSPKRDTSHATNQLFWDCNGKGHRFMLNVQYQSYIIKNAI